MVNRQLRDKESGNTLRLLPLAVDFRPRKRFSLGALRSAISLSVITSFRQASQEANYEIRAGLPLMPWCIGIFEIFLIVMSLV